MPGGGPVVTAPRGVHGALRRCTWLDPAPSVGSQHSPRPHLGDATSPGPPLPTPAGQMSPHPTPTALHGYRTPAADTVGSKPGFPLLVTADPSGNLLHTSGSPLRVTCCRQGCGTQLSHREYFSVLSLLFKVPFCKGCLRL